MKKEILLHSLKGVQILASTKRDGCLVIKREILSSHLPKLHSSYSIMSRENFNKKAIPILRAKSRWCNY